MDTNKPFYIGIGCKPNFFRAFESDPRKRNNIWNKIVSKTNWSVKIIAFGLSKEDAAIREQIFITALGRIDLNNGPLANLTDGGDGIHNCIRSLETRKKLSIQKLGDKNPQFGKKQSQDLIDKRMQNMRGRKISAEQKNNHLLSTIKNGQAKTVSVYIFSTGEFIGTFVSLSLACKTLGLEKFSSKASQVARNRRSHVHNYKFVYE